MLRILLILSICNIASGHSPSLLLDESASPQPLDADVLIIGAGIAGLEAARLLREKGVHTLILEARERTGGRIWTIRSRTGHAIDMGAAWIHGIHGGIPNGLYSNPLWDLTLESQLATRGTHADDVQKFAAEYNSTEQFDAWLEEFMKYAREETRLATSNLSFEYYAKKFIERKNFNQKQQEIFYSSLNYLIENTEGARLSQISAKGFLDLTSTHYGDEHIFHQDGFMALTDYLSQFAGEIRLGQIVQRISLHATSVEVESTDGQVYRSKYALLTVPLGVLKARAITFEPALPRWKLDAIDRLGYGNFEKVVLVWPEAWWNSSHFYFLRISSAINHFGYWVNLNKWQDKPALICFFAGPSEYRQQFLREQQRIVTDIHATLQEMFPEANVPPPAEAYITEWTEDPFSRGSYSYISVNQKYEDPSYLGEPVGDRLLFAGEATSPDSYGFAHGALLSARREATRLLYASDPFYHAN